MDKKKHAVNKISVIVDMREFKVVHLGRSWWRRWDGLYL